MYTGTLLGERCMTQRSGPGALQGGVVGSYSSGELAMWTSGRVYPGYGTNDQGPTHENSAKQCQTVPNSA